VQGLLTMSLKAFNQTTLNGKLQDKHRLALSLLSEIMDVSIHISLSPQTTGLKSGRHL
jgi:hypothetical protein